MTDTPNTPTTDTTASVTNNSDAQIVLLENGQKVQLNMPSEAGQQAVVVAKGVSQIVANFDADQAEVVYEGDSLIFKFEDGSQTVIEQFGLEDPMPEIVLQDGTIVAGDTIVAQLDGADDLFTLETAAGGNAQSGGGSSYSEELGDVIDMLDANGPLPFGSFVRETADDEEFDGLDAGPGVAPLNDTPEIGPAATLLDETDDMGDVISGTVPIDFGADGPGTVSPMDVSDVTSSVPLMSGGQPVTIVLTMTGYAGVLPNGEPVFELVLNDDGTYTYQQLLPLDHPDGMDPNDPIEIDFGIEASDADGDSIIGNIVVTILDDGPSIENATNIVDETTDIGSVVTGAVDIDFGEDGVGSLDTNGDFVSSVTLESDGEPITVAEGPNGYVGTLADGTVVFEMTLNPDGTYSFVQYLPIDHPDTGDHNDAIDLTFGIVGTDGDGDSMDGTITVTILDDGPVVYDQQMNQMILSDDGIMGATHYGDPVLFDYGQDGAGSIDVSGAFNSSETLMSGGQVVTVIEGPNGYVGTLPDGTVVFEMTLNPDGTYSFTQYEPLDHPDGVDQISLDFGVIVTDGDGDTDTGNITVYINDGGPEIDANGGLVVDETNTIGVPVQGQIDIDFGGDGPGGTITPIQVNGDFSSSVPLTSGGLPVTMGLVPNVGSHPAYVGVLPDGTEVFHITFNADGSYTFTQLLPLDHPDSMDPDDLIELNFGLTITDGDGDSIDITVTVGVHDDGPVAVDDWDFVSEKTGIAEGNVLTGEGTFGEPDPDIIFNNGFEEGAGADDPGADVDMSVVAVHHVRPEGARPADHSIEPGGAVTVEGSYGVLTIHSDGSYTYELFPGVEIDPNNPYDVFTYTMIDGDGDSDQAELVLDHTALVDDVPEIGDDEITLDETDGFGITVSDALDYDFGDDGAGSIDANGNVDSTVPLTSGGETVTVTAGPNGYVGTLADGTVIFELNINDDGTYDFTQFGPLDHPISGNPGSGAHDDLLSIEFGVTISDSDGDTDTGTITINIRDDGPSIGPHFITGDESTDMGVTITGQIGGEEAQYGADGAGYIEGRDFSRDGWPVNGAWVHSDAGLHSGGEPVTIAWDPATSTHVATTPDGTVVFTVLINADGSYELTMYEPIDHPQNDPNLPNLDDEIMISLGIRIYDADGDWRNGEVCVIIRDDEPEVVEMTKALVNEGFDLGEPMQGSITFDYGADSEGTAELTGNLTAVAPHSSGNTPIELTHNGQLITMEPNPSGDGFVGVTPDGSVAFTVTMSPDGSYVYTQLLPFDHPGADADGLDRIRLRFEVTGTDADGDVVTSQIVIMIDDSRPVALDDVDSFGQNDTILTGNVVTGEGTDTGNADIIGGDVEGHHIINVHVGPEGNGAAPVTILEGGSVQIEGLYGTLTLHSDGSYSYVLNGPVDPNNPVDVFTYTIIDGDGDTDQATLTIDATTIANDTDPEIADEVMTVDETDQIGDVVQGTLDIDYGNDGPGTISLNGATSTSVGSLTSGGAAVTITMTANGYVGTLADGTPVFTLNVGANGVYNFTQHLPLDHPDSGDHDDLISLNFGVIATDSGGDTDVADITINIHDDGPEAVNDWNYVGYNDADRTVDGDILNNDSFGEDGGSTVTTIAGVDLPATGTVTINGLYGVLTISADGSYSYTAHPGSEGRIDNFVYTIYDGDGDVDSAVLIINIAAEPPGPDPVIVDASIMVDEGVLVPGSNAAYGMIQIDHFGDFESVQFTGMVSNASQGQTSEGNLITFQQVSPYEFRAVADGQIVFTVTIANDGSYTVSMNQNIDHGPGNHFVDMQGFSFSFEATDDDGNTVNGWLGVNIADDNPFAHHDFYTVSEDGVSSGNVTLNDDLSTVDSASSFVHMVTHWGDPAFVDVPGMGDDQSIANGGFTTITGNYGVLTLHSDGSYTYEPFDNLDLTGPVQDCFSYTLLETDGDGSFNGAHLFFTVTPDGTTSMAPTLDVTDMSDTSGEEAAVAMDEDQVDLGELIAIDESMIGPPDQGIGLTVEDPVALDEVKADYSYDAGDVIDLSELIDVDSGSVEELAIENFVRFDTDSGVLQVDASGQGSFDAENTQEVAVHGYDGGNIKLAIEDMVVDTDFTG